MTNEELAIKIQAGETSFLNDLWSQVERFVRLKAYSYSYKYESLCAQAGVTIEDIYQAGFFALLKAVEAYKPNEEIPLLGYFKYPLANEFGKLTGLRSRKQITLNSALSLESTKDGDAPALFDSIADESSENDLEDVIDEEYRLSLRKALDQAIDSLSQKQAYIIRGQFFDDLTKSVLAERLKISQGRINTLQNDAFRALRKRAELIPYRDEIISRFEYKGSFSTWKNTGMSPQERIILRLEEKGLL